MICLHLKPGFRAINIKLISLLQMKLNKQLAATAETCCDGNEKINFGFSLTAGLAGQAVTLRK